MKAFERLLNYTQINTNSNDDSTTCPSSENQWILAKQLVKELHSLGVDNAYVDEHCYVYANVPARGEAKQKYTLGLIAHLDTSNECDGGPVKYSIIEKYNGKDIVQANGEKISVEEFPFLNHLIDHDLIITDGNSLLGADNKAGIAIIMTLIEQLMANPTVPHCELYICFTPDEEIGRGADLFDVNQFKVDFAYTIDGSALGEIEYENFNAADAVVEIKGKSIHPGSAKLKMKNAARLAAKFDALLPEFDRPEYTEKYEGFFHLCHIEAGVEQACLNYIIRDHDTKAFENKKQILESICEYMNALYGDGTVSLSIKDTYFNMKEKILEKPESIEIAKKAFIDSRVEPIFRPIRGGTDGARISFMGIPCPNLSTGGYNFHSRKELASIQEMDKMVEVLLNLVK